MQQGGGMHHGHTGGVRQTQCGGFADVKLAHAGHAYGGLEVAI